MRKAHMVRGLTPAERAMAAEMFGPALDADRVQLHRAAWWPLQPSNTIMAPDGDIWFPPKGSSWHEDFGRASLGWQALFVHELTHVWQAQRGGRWFLPLVRHPFCHYRYRLEPGRSFGRYGVEQQAEMVRHLFMARRGAPVAGAPDRCELEALLPFSSDRATP
jgi:hypothetical protein